MLAVAASIAGLSTACASDAGTAGLAAAARGVHVAGNRLVDGGRTIVLHGADRAGTEYACIQGFGIFDGPDPTNDDSQLPLMKKWGVTSVNVGLNEDCWLDVNTRGIKSAYVGSAYAKAIVHETKTAEQYGIHPIIALFWEAPGGKKAGGQIAMPDADHAPAFWRSVAQTFKGDPNVIFRLKEEPFPAGNTDSAAAWRCWKNGDVQYGRSGQVSSRHANCHEGYPAVGMQSLINIIRSTGARNVIQVPGVQYANSMTDFLTAAYRVKDTLGSQQLMGVVDVYPKTNPCGSTACYSREYGPVIKRMPFMAGEIGEGAGNPPSCPTTAVSALMGWFDKHRAGYGAWDWDTWGGCLQLISSYKTGAPDGAWGRLYHNHLASLR